MDPDRSPLAQQDGSGTDKDHGSRLAVAHTRLVSAQKTSQQSSIRPDLIWPEFDLGLLIKWLIWSSPFPGPLFKMAHLPETEINDHRINISFSL